MLNCFRSPFRCVLLTVPLLTLGVFSGNAQTAMSLEDCVQYAFANHPEIKLADLEIRDADWQIRENTAVALPQLTAGINLQHFLQQPALPAEALGIPGVEPGTKLTFALKTNITGTVGVNQLLFSNSYLRGVRAAKEYRAYVDLQKTAVQRKLRNSVTDAYLPALLVSENIEILERNIGTQENLLGETREIYKAGFAEQLDVDRIEYTVSTLRSQRDNLERQREILVDMLQFAIHMPVGEELTLVDDISVLLEEYADVNPQEALDYMNRPDYVALLKARDLSEIQVDLYDKHWLPTLSAFAQYQPSYQGNDELFWIPSAIVGLQLNIPIYDGGMARAKKERALVTVAETDIQKETLEHAFTLELEIARKQLESARLKVQTEEQNLSLAQRIYDTAQTKFQVGVGSSLEVTQAQAGLYQTQALLIQARYDVLLASIAVKHALGN